MSDSVYSFRAGPIYRAASRQELFDSAMEQPLSLTSTFFDQAKGGALESYGLGTAIRDFAIPEGAATPETTVRSALRLTNPLTAAYESTRLAVQAFREDSPTLDETKYKASPYYRENIPWDAGMTEARAKALAEWNDAKQVRQYYAQKRPISAFLGNLTGQAFDPINYIPVGGPLVKAAAAARAGRVGGAVITGAVDAATNTALAGFATRETRGRLGDDVSFQAMVSEIATAALIGAAFGGISGAMEARTAARALADAQRTLSTLKATQEARIALNEAIDGVVRGEGVNLTPNAVQPITRIAGELESASLPRGGFVSMDAGDRLGVANNGGSPAVKFQGETFVAANHAQAIEMASAKYGDAVKAAIENAPDKHVGYVTDRVDASGIALIPADHGEMGIPEPRQGMDDRVYAIHRDGESIGFANIRVDGDVATVRDIYSVDTLDSRNSIGTKAVARLMRQFVRENPGIRTIAGERVSGARRGGKHGLAGTGEDVSIRLPKTRLAVDTIPSRLEPTPEGRQQAETRIAKPDDYKTLADQYRVDPETGDFPELADIDNLRAEGRLTADDIAELDATAATVDDAKAYGDALKAVVGCLV